LWSSDILTFRTLRSFCETPLKCDSAVLENRFLKANNFTEMDVIFVFLRFLIDNLKNASFHFPIDKSENLKKSKGVTL